MAESTSKMQEKLESQVSAARAAAQKTSQELKAHAADSGDEASRRWSEIGQEWHDQTAKIHEKINREKEKQAAHA